MVAYTPAWNPDETGLPRLLPRMDLAEWAESRLRSNPYLALKNVSCRYHDGVLTLEGCLPSYYLKQVAQEVVAPLAGVERIENQIEVIAAAAK